jgi:hypothetical protein
MQYTMQEQLEPPGVMFSEAREGKKTQQTIRVSSEDNNVNHKKM